MSLFDKLCGMVERCDAAWTKATRGMLADAGRFDFDGAYAGIDSDVLKRETADEPLRLPFVNTVIDIGAGCCLFHAMTAEDEADRERRMPPPLPGKYGATVDGVKYIGAEDGDVGFVLLMPHGPDVDKLNYARGVFRMVGIKLEVRVTGVGVYERDSNAMSNMLDHGDDPLFPAVPSDQISGLLKAFVEHLFVINMPTRFVVEIAPPAPRKAPKKLLRSHERPAFTLLTPHEIKHRFLPNATIGGEPVHGFEGSQRVPHAKRGHWRTYAAERFVHRRGQRQWIEACWVGPREAVVNGKLYRVRTDL